MPRVVNIVCRPLRVPEGGSGRFAVLSLSAETIQDLLSLHKQCKELAKLLPRFYRASFFCRSGEWLASLGSDDLNEEFGDVTPWRRLPDSYAAVPADTVRSDLWTVDVSAVDVIWCWYEKHIDQEIASPPLTIERLQFWLQELEA